MAENLQGICETLHSVLKMTKKSECILKLSLLFLVQRLEPKFLYLLSRQTLFQWATSLSPECLNISIYLLNGNASLYSFFSVSVVRIFPPMIFSPFHPPAFVVYFNFQSSRYCRKVAVRGLSWPGCGRSCLQYKYLGSWSKKHTESLRTVWATVIHSQLFPPPQRNKNKK